MINESHFLKNARAIRSALDLGWKDYISQFGMTQKDAAKHLLNPENFPVSYAMNFCEYYELDIENAFSDQFDVKAFARNYLKEEPTLPERYRHEKNSKVITLVNFVNGLNDSDLGWLNVLIFRRLQIPKSILLYPEIEIPFKLISDYLELIEKYCSQIDLFYEIGLEGIQKLNKQFSFISKESVLNADFYDEFFSDKIRIFDKTYNYQFITKNNNELILKCSLKEEFKDLYKTKSFSSRSLLSYKRGIASGLSILFNSHPRETNILKGGLEQDYDLISIRTTMPLTPMKTHLH
jgi:hypothetical protein